MQLGFVLPNNFGIDDVADVVDLAVAAEDRGFASAWVNHHVLNVGYVADRLGGRPYHDALTVLTAAAVRTTRVRLGTSVMVLPYVHPMGLAKSLATLDGLSHGRVIAGVGVGSLAEENAALGVRFEGRGPWADEAIQVMQALWAGPGATFAGEHFSFTDLTASPLPVQHPLPLWIGGGGAPAQRRAARFGQGWHPMCSVDGLARRMPGFVDVLTAHGRTRSDIVVAPRVAASTVSDASAIESWSAAGADQLIVGTNTADLDEIRRELDRLAELLPTAC